MSVQPHENININVFFNSRQEQKIIGSVSYLYSNNTPFCKLLVELKHSNCKDKLTSLLGRTIVFALCSQGLPC